MSDVGDHIARQAYDVETGGSNWRDGVENDAAHVESSRWWFTGSVFPMMAGILGPVASAFSICALVRPWRQLGYPGSDVATAEFVDDPVWLITVNAIQLVLALVANFFLLFNMARRIPFTVAQPITITGWYASAFALIALTATAAGPLRKDVPSQVDWIWSEGFYYGIFAAILYLIVATLLVFTFHDTLSNRYRDEKEFQLTPSQRTLMLQTIVFLIYLLLGALAFSKIEGWSYLDAVYWADITLFTVGFGDFVPSTVLGRALLFPFVLIGIISLGLVVGCIRTLIVEYGRHKRSIHAFDKERVRVLERLSKQGKDHILEPISEEGLHNRLAEYKRRGEEFELMRKLQHKHAASQRWWNMARSSSTWLALWLMGAAIFQACEAPYQNWSYFDGVYFAYISLTTIGYGEIAPISPPGKSFFVFWSLLALPTTTVLISNAGDTIVKAIRDGTDALGAISILPSDKGFRRQFKAILLSLSCGLIFREDDIREDPPGFLGAAQPVNIETPVEEEHDVEADNGCETRKVEISSASGKDCAMVVPESTSHSADAADAQSKSGLDTTWAASRSFPNTDDSAHSRGSRQTPYLSKRSTMHSATNANTQLPGLGHRTLSIPRTHFPSELHRTRAEYRCQLIDEIVRVMQHLRHDPPRKYTFDEWAWYLRLIGEDEHNAKTHHKAQAHSHHHHHRGKQHSHTHSGHGKEAETATAAAQADREQRQQWSWVGARSPLMSSQEEAEWILERLTAQLQAELRMAQREGM